ncbi:Transcriptional regulator [Marasmius tenuissimus]|uniref:Transcriptional regulator n=1 Tax=Marasmius tenuissimus TaxID=585030 RepID=A0ABR3AA37_9AGAR
MLHPFPPPRAPPLLTQPLSKDVPPIEELEALYSELKALKQRSYDRAKKAESDAKIVEESFRKMKEREREKGKGKERLEDPWAKDRDRDRERDRQKERRERRGSSVSVTLTDGGSSHKRAGSNVSGHGDRIEKVKKERDYTPSPSDITSVRQRLANSGASGSPSTKGSYDHKSSEEKKKKKKRKRDEGSDVEPDFITNGFPSVILALPMIPFAALSMLEPALYAGQCTLPTGLSGLFNGHHHNCVVRVMRLELDDYYLAEPSHAKSAKAGAGTSANSSASHYPSISHSNSSNAHGHSSKASISIPKTFPGSATPSASVPPQTKNLPDFSLPVSTALEPLLPARPSPTPIQKHYSAIAAELAASSSSDSSPDLPEPSSPSPSSSSQPSGSSSSSQPWANVIPQPRHPHLPKYEPILHGPPSSHPAHPLHSLDVHDDFSKLKPPAQILVNTFYGSVEPWVRPIKEEDVGLLEWEGDVIEPFIMPKLGRWYESVWEDLDNGIPPQTPEVKGNKNWDPHNTSFAAPIPQWDPSTLKDDDLQNERRGHGPLTERLISALMPIEGAMASWKGVKAAEDAMEGRPGGSGAAASKRERVVSVEDLETRIRDTMRAYGLLGPRETNGPDERPVTTNASGMPDYSEKVDDPIATALRHAQAELRAVSATNRARKLRLAAIARDRLGYQEYLDGRDALDKNINLCYAKLQKRDSGQTKGRKKGKKDKDKERGDSVSLSLNGMSASVGGTPAPNANGIDGEPPPPCPAALGLGPDPETHHLVVTEQLKTLIDTRRKWVDDVGAVFDDMERKTSGRVWGIPQSSVFEGLEAEVQEILKERLGLLNKHEAENGPAVNGHSGVNGITKMDGIVETGSAKRSHFGSKGKERQVRGDEMDVG